MTTTLTDRWALILGASSGHGAATARELAQQGMNIIGVHLDLRTTMPAVKQLINDIEGAGRQALFFNTNAADAKKRGTVTEEIRAKLPENDRIKIFMHSLAFGSLKPYLPADREGAVTKAQMEMTLDVMAHSLVYWVQELAYAELLGRGSKVFAMTSAGSHRVWDQYGPVGCAKAALEYHVKHLAVELVQRGIAVNAIQAGITDTPALRKIPGHEEMLRLALERSPGGRATTPEDVARAIALLANDESSWMTGNVIDVDGAEDLIMG